MTIRNARVSRTKNVGAPWLGRSLVSGSARQIFRMRARTSSGRSVIPEIDDEPGRRRQRQHAEVDLLLEADGPRKHCFEVAGTHHLAHDGRPGHTARALVDEV